MSDVSLDLNTVEIDDGYQVKVAGELDMATADQLVRYVDGLPDGGLVLDLSGVEFIDSSGIQALIKAHNHRAAHNDLLTIRGLPAGGLAVLRIARLDDYLDLEDDTDRSSRV